MWPVIVTPYYVRAQAKQAENARVLQLRELRPGEGLTQAMRQSAGQALISLGNWVKPRSTSLPLGRPNWAGR